jgi:hypothetical protein
MAEAQQRLECLVFAASERAYAGVSDALNMSVCIMVSCENRGIAIETAKKEIHLKCVVRIAVFPDKQSLSESA